MQADNGSFIYMMPGVQPGYTPYSSYFPATTIGVDGQYSAQQVLPQSPLLQPPVTPPGYFPPCGELVASPYFWDASVVGDFAYGFGYTGDMENAGSKSSLSSLSHSQKLKPKFPSDYSSSVESKRSLPSSAMVAGHKQSKSFNKVYHLVTTMVKCCSQKF